VNDTVLLAVDGGNSKTDVALLSARGAVLAAVRGPGSSPHMLGLEGSLRVVDDLIARASDHAGIDDRGGPVASFGAWFMAGADLPAEERSLQRAIERLGRAAQNTVANDTFALLRAGADEGWGVAAVVGAGINCVGLSPEGRRARFLSLGKVSGDWGGGSDIGLAALGVAVQSEEGRATATRLRSDVATHFDQRRASDVAIAFHQHRFHHDRLRELAPIVIAAAEAGDRAAVDIMNRQADEVVSWISGAIRRLRIARLDVPVVLGGSILAAMPKPFATRIETGVRQVALNAHITICRDRPVIGAALAALDLAGVDGAAAHELRSALRTATFKSAT
jgi:N-acetylglucosamine kinase-like BadF-type ATPase